MLLAHSAVRTSMVPRDYVEAQSSGIQGDPKTDGECALRVRKAKDGEFSDKRTEQHVNHRGQSDGTAEPSFVSQALENSLLSPKEERSIQWAAAALYGGWWTSFACYQLHSQPFVRWL